MVRRGNGGRRTSVGARREVLEGEVDLVLGLLLFDHVADLATLTAGNNSLVRHGLEQVSRAADVGQGAQRVACQRNEEEEEEPFVPPLLLLQSSSPEALTLLRARSFISA